MAVAWLAIMTAKHQNVVVAYDFSEHGRAVLDRAIALVARAPFHVLHFIIALDPRQGIPAVPTDGPIDYEYADRVREYVEVEIEKAFSSADIASAMEFYVHARIGSPADEILDLATEIGADLIFIGTHGYTGIKHLIKGSVAEHVVRDARCPVMVVRPKGYPDVALDTVVEIPAHKRPTSRLYRFSYQNSQMIMRPPTWPIH